MVILRLPRRLEWQWKRDSREILGEPEIYDPPPPGIVVERSHCPHCKHQLSWYENIPVFSWLALRGKCRNCKAPISLQYPLVELLTMLLVVACVWRFGFGWQGFGAIVLTCFLIALSGIDLRTQLLPDQLTLPLLWLGLIAASTISTSGRSRRCWARSPATSACGRCGGCSSSSPARKAWATATSSCWPRSAPGSGLNGILPTILLSSLVGAIIGSVWLAMKGRDRATPIPFGPYLAIAGWIVFFWGEQMVDAYMRVSQACRSAPWARSRCPAGAPWARPLSMATWQTGEAVARRVRSYMMPRMSDFLIGLTGGVASGKSEVTRRFEALGVVVADADLVARAAVAPGSDGLAEVVRACSAARCWRPTAASTARRCAGACSPTTRRARRLEAIIHPRVRIALQQRLPSRRPVRMRSPRSRCWPKAAAATPIRGWHRILVVDVPVAVQRARLMQRDGIDAALAERMIAAQATRAAAAGDRRRRGRQRRAARTPGCAGRGTRRPLPRPRRSLVGAHLGATAFDGDANSR